MLPHECFCCPCWNYWSLAHQSSQLPLSPLWRGQAIFLLNVTDVSLGLSSKKQGLWEDIMLHKPGALSHLSPICTHKCSHWTALLSTPHETLPDLTWISPPLPLLFLLCNLAFNLLPSSSSFHYSTALSDLTFLLFSSAHGLSPELVCSPITTKPDICGVFQGRKQGCFTVTKGQSLSGEELKSGRNIWIASGKSPSKQWDSQCVFVSVSPGTSYERCSHQCRQVRDASINEVTHLPR